MKIAIYGSRRQAPYADSLRCLLRSLTLAGADIVMAPKLFQHLEGDLGISLPGVTEAPSTSSLPSGTDLVLSIGGDGTFLRSAAWAGDSEVPVLGINSGHLGYLTAIAVEEAPGFVDYILSGNYNIEHRTLIEVVTPAVKGSRFALNEVVMAKDDSSSTINACASINGRGLATYRADGLIVATPTGSTAYNLSVGGPIVQPNAPVWIISPIACHSLGMRPLVVSDDSVISVRIEGYARSFRLTLDGRSTIVPMGNEVRLRRAPYSTLIVQRPGVEFPAVLRNKLLFSN